MREKLQRPKFFNTIDSHDAAAMPQKKPKEIWTKLIATAARTPIANFKAAQPGSGGITWWNAKKDRLYRSLWLVLQFNSIQITLLSRRKFTCDA